MVPTASTRWVGNFVRRYMHEREFSFLKIEICGILCNFLSPVTICGRKNRFVSQW
jgi:hypothetical protein